MKRFILSTLLGLFSLASFAQLNGNFKSVRFVNVSDSTTVLPINATIYYNEQSNKFRAYENDQWVDLISQDTTQYGTGNVFGDGIISGRVPYAYGLDSLTSEAGFEYNQTTNLLTAPDISISSLTPTRVLIGGTGGLIFDQAGFTFNAGELTTPSLTISDLTATYIPFGGVAGSVDTDASFIYDATLNQILLGNVAATSATSIFGGEIQLDTPGDGDDFTINPTGATFTGNAAAVFANASGPVNLQSSSGTLAVTAVGSLASGSYSPTGTAESNATSVVVATHYYTRVGNIVSVNGLIAFDNTTGGADTAITITLPFASNFTSNEQCTGGGYVRPNAGGANATPRLSPDTTDDEARISFNITTTGAHTVGYSFQYVIL